ncbi:uncharacterized protein B0I36DRAFT_378938 [Microdochium trichocladiopsis]|uniref:Mid2 domain-containing protein n=1 Tax=Microdochium trichocladiopsis TaxID=1682393 RepID=A0A9P8YGG0_9PEZI|nr:uncharacterized protein B0I36DRAFT_378938 [Microdochium trichocladiopsis]KAH7039830.1 hypothetical protein B0I36DRAFT_378938 [Microdochium trichocladiopsis]
MVAFLLASVAAAAMLSQGAEASFEPRVPKQTADVVATAVLSQTTPAPEGPPALMYARAAGTFTGTLLLAPDNVCGYVSGDASRPWSCDATDKCGFATVNGGWAACCKGLSCSISQVACVDRAAVSTASLCGSSCLSDPGTRKCTVSTLPYCGTLTFFDGIVDYQCVATNSSTFAQVELTYAGQENFASGATAYMMTTVVFEAQTTFTLSSSSSTSSTSTISTPATSSSTSTTPVPAPSQGSSTPIGAIVGGVVGGVALIALIAFGIWFMKSRQKKAASAAEAQAMMNQNTGAGGPHAGVPGMAPMQSPYTTGAGQYPPSGYNPNPQYTGSVVGPDPSVSPNPGMSYYQDPTKQGFQQNVTPDAHRQSYQQGPVPAAWAQHTGGSGHQPSQHTGSSATAAQQYPQHSGSQPTYYEASGNPIGANDPNPNHRGQLHELS